MNDLEAESKKDFKRFALMLLCKSSTPVINSVERKTGFIKPSLAYFCQ